MRYVAIIVSAGGTIIFALLGFVNSLFLVPFGACLALTLLGVWDMMQTKHSLRRNYPILANLRFALEKIRPEIRQYFLESDTDGTPFNRAKRAIVYQRAKGQLDKRPFGTHKTSTTITSNGCTSFARADASRASQFPHQRRWAGLQSALFAFSIFNISAMSFGSLSANAIRALNKGAKLGGFAHDTGEGGFSRYHREFGGDIIWEIGADISAAATMTARSARRICRAGGRSADQDDRDQAVAGRQAGPWRRAAGRQGDEEIAAARRVRSGVDCVSPAVHTRILDAIGD